MKASSPIGDVNQSALLERASSRLRTAMALFESGLALKRAQLRRQDAAASEEQLAMRLASWLRTRPGARYGDSAGELRDLLTDE